MACGLHAVPCSPDEIRVSGAPQTTAPALHAGSIDPLAEARARIADVSAPVLRQQPLLHITMKRRMPPIGHARYQTVFDGIVVDVIDMARKVRLIPNSVLPEPSLPQPIFSARVAL